MKNKGGRPPHQRTQDIADKVEMLSGLGLPIENISSLVGICAETVMKYYGAEAGAGKAKANKKVAQFLFQKAQDDLTAAIWWSKTQMRWRDAPTEIEVTQKTPVISISLNKVEPNAAAPKVIDAQFEDRHLPAPKAEPGISDKSE